MSNSFYGGKRGFSFILQKNPHNVQGYFNSSEEILTAVKNGDLKYGEYAMVSSGEEQGFLYRAVFDNIVLCGKMPTSSGGGAIQYLEWQNYP